MLAYEERLPAWAATPLFSLLLPRHSYWPPPPPPHWLSCSLSNAETLLAYALAAVVPRRLGPSTLDPAQTEQIGPRRDPLLTFRLSSIRFVYWPIHCHCGPPALFPSETTVARIYVDPPVELPLETSV